MDDKVQHTGVCEQFEFASNAVMHLLRDFEQALTASDD